MTAAQPQPEKDVVRICRDLIRMDTSNYGDDPRSGERVAAEYVAEQLADVGLDVELVESAPGRTSVFARLEGVDRSRPALMLHGHLDVVPADATEWTHPPFAAEVVEEDGLPTLWGRGAVDMKDMDAMILSLVRDRARTARRPPRDLVIGFFADEEAGGRFGSHWLVEHRPDLFDGVDVAVSEVGGFSVTVPSGQRLYLVETGEKGLAWMRVTATGRAGHGSMVNDENAVTRLAAAVGRLGSHEFPVHVTPTVRLMLDRLGEALGLDPTATDPEELAAAIAPAAPMLLASLRHTVNPTMLDGGYKANVVPGSASAVVDGRFLPGLREEFFTVVDELLGPDVRRESLVDDIAFESDPSARAVSAMGEALAVEDPGSGVLPYLMSAGTDAKALAGLGIAGYGFAPLRLPPGFPFGALFHGVDERVPLDALEFGAKVLDRFVDLA